MRAAAAPLLLALVGALASGSALAFKSGVKGGGGGGGGSFNKSSSGFNKGSGHFQHHGSGHPHHHHGHGSVTFVGVGFGFAYPWYYPPPYYYPAHYPYYQPVVYQAEPAAYVEQSTTPAVEPAGWWYYCETSRAYYPYVKECPSGWQRVPAAPPPPR